jgi:hypothetical protein
MSANFQVVLKKQNGNLYLDPRGDLDGSSAWELVNAIQDHYEGCGQVVINTRQLRRMCPFGCSTFKCRFRMCRVPAECLLLRGEKGDAIAPEGSHVQLDNHRQHACEGGCPNCRCKKKHRS